MANVGKLTVTLTALTGRFGKGMRKAGGTVARFASEVGAASARLAALSTGAATVAAVAIGFLTHKQMEAIDATAKVADRLGSTTEALMGMRHAANLAGVGTEEFDKAQEKLSKNLGDPSKATADALAKIGLNSATLLRMNPAERFSAIADAINKLGSQAEKAAVATALFGRTGATLLNTFDLGSAGLKLAADEMNRLAGSISRVDAAKVEEANDQMTRLKTIFDGVFAKLAVEVSPFISELAAKFINLGSDGRSAADVISEGAVNMARDMLRLVDIVDLAIAGFYALGGAALQVSSYWDRAQAFMTELVVNIQDNLSFGTIGKDGLDDELDRLLESSATKTGDAARAFFAAKEKLGAAITGERSNSAKTAFDNIRSGAGERASKAVGDQSAARTAASSKAAAQQLGDAFRKYLQKGNAIVSATNSQAFVADTIKSISGFFKSLPDRARAFGVVNAPPVVDPQTSVRGTFSGETAGRMSSSLTVQTKQLEEQRKMAFSLDLIAGRLVAGVPIP